MSLACGILLFPRSFVFPSCLRSLLPNVIKCHREASFLLLNVVFRSERIKKESLVSGSSERITATAGCEFQMSGSSVGGLSRRQDQRAEGDRIQTKSGQQRLRDKGRPTFGAESDRGLSAPHHFADAATREWATYWRGRRLYTPCRPGSCTPH